MDLLKAMRTFVDVADEGSLAAAARVRDLSPAAVTRLLSQLEDHLGARLLQRTPRRMVLTDVGQAYLERARGILAKVDEASAAAGQYAHKPAGRLQLVAPSMLLSHQVAPLLPAFGERHPDIQLSLQAGSMRPQPDETADLTLIVAPLGTLDGSFVARLLAHSEVLLCASVGYLAEHGRPQHPRQLQGHPLLVSNSMRKRHGLQWRFEPAAGGAAVVISGQLFPGLDTEHRETLHDAMKAGLGIGPMLSFAAAADLRAGRLQRVLPDWRCARYGVWAATLTRKHPPARVRLTIDFLVAAFGGREHDPWLAGLPPAHATPTMCAVV